MKQALVGVQEPENACFRLSLGQKGPELAIDQTRPGDHEIQYDGEVVLAVEPSVEEAMRAREIDYDLEKERLILVACHLKA